MLFWFVRIVLVVNVSCLVCVCVVCFFLFCDVVVLLFVVCCLCVLLFMWGVDCQLFRACFVVCCYMVCCTCMQFLFVVFLVDCAVFVFVCGVCLCFV